MNIEAAKQAPAELPRAPAEQSNKVVEVAAPGLLSSVLKVKPDGSAWRLFWVKLGGDGAPEVPVRIEPFTTVDASPSDEAVDRRASGASAQASSLGVSKALSSFAAKEIPSADSEKEQQPSSSSGCEILAALAAIDKKLNPEVHGHLQNLRIREAVRCWSLPGDQKDKFRKLYPFEAAPVKLPSWEEDVWRNTQVNDHFRLPCGNF